MSELNSFWNVILSEFLSYIIIKNQNVRVCKVLYSFNALKRSKTNETFSEVNEKCIRLLITTFIETSVFVPTVKIYLNFPMQYYQYNCQYGRNWRLIDLNFERFRWEPILGWFWLFTFTLNFVIRQIVLFNIAIYC